MSLIEWNIYGLINLVGALFLGALALLVFATRPMARENRRLATFIALWAGLVGTVAGGYLSTSAGAVAGWSGLTMAFWFATIPALLRFLAVLDSPLSRPLRAPWVDRALLAALVLAPVSWFLVRSYFLKGVIPFEPHVPLRPDWGEAFARYAQAHVGVVTLSIFVALTAYLRAPPTSARRRQMAAYALAAVAADILTILRQIFLLPHFNKVVRTEGLSALSDWEVLAYLTSNAAIAVVFVVLMTYGILAVQMFDIDLRIKAGIARGTVAVIFILVFFAVSRFAAGFVSERLGATAGIVVVALLIFLIAPLQRLGERISDAAMPSVQDTPTYRAQRKEAVYEGAIESLLVGAAGPEKERAALLRMQHDLGIDAATADRLEADVRARHGA